MKEDIESLTNQIKSIIGRDITKKVTALKRDFIKEIEDQYCVCGCNMCAHENGSSNPSPCQDCSCKDYNFSLPWSVKKEFDEWLNMTPHQEDFEHQDLFNIMNELGMYGEAIRLQEEINDIS